MITFSYIFQTLDFLFCEIDRTVEYWYFIM